MVWKSLSLELLHWNFHLFIFANLHILLSAYNVPSAVILYIRDLPLQTKIFTLGGSTAAILDLWSLKDEIICSTIFEFDRIIAKQKWSFLICCQKIAAIKVFQCLLKEICSALNKWIRQREIFGAKICSTISFIRNLWHLVMCP